jgi:hypothetical protein
VEKENLICSVGGRRKPNLVQLPEEENLICSVGGRRKPDLFSCERRKPNFSVVEEENLICSVVEEGFRPNQLLNFHLTTWHICNI